MNAKELNIMHEQYGHDRVAKRAALNARHNAEREVLAAKDQLTWAPSSYTGGPAGREMRVARAQSRLIDAEAEHMQAKVDASRAKDAVDAWGRRWERGGDLREAHYAACAEEIAEGKTRFDVVTSAACMPQSCWGKYRHVAVLEVAANAIYGIDRIDDRPRSVKRIVEQWRDCNVGVAGAGGGGKCAYSRSLAEAKELAAELNAA